MHGPMYIKFIDAEVGFKMKQEQTLGSGYSKRWAQQKCVHTGT